MSTKDCFQEGQAAALPFKDGEGQYPSLSEIYSANHPPKLPGKLPKLVSTVTSQTPFQYKETVAQGMFPPLAIYPKKLSFNYLDNQPRELRISTLTIGNTGDGKDACFRQPLSHILADAKRLDEVNRQRLADFNKAFTNTPANALKPQRPEDLIIQIINSNITQAALVQRMDEAQGAPLYTKMNELEQWEQIEGASGKNNQFTTMKLADDENNDFGADRAGTQSVTASGNLFLNWNANTTISKAIRFFKNVLTDGPISRLCLAFVPPSEIGSDIPKFGKYDYKYDAKLRPFIENLKKATGTITCKKALQMVENLKKECDDFSILTQDRVFDNLTHRALVHAFRKGCLLYAANGMKWESSIYDFCRWSLHYDLWLKMKLFGDAIKKEDAGVEVSKRGPQSLLDEIATDDKGVFSIDALVKVRKQKGMREDGTRKLLSKWKSRGYIRQLSDDTFQKIQPEDKK